MRARGARRRMAEAARKARRRPSGPPVRPGGEGRAGAEPLAPPAPRRGREPSADRRGAPDAIRRPARPGGGRRAPPIRAGPRQAIRRRFRRPVRRLPFGAIRGVAPTPRRAAAGRGAGPSGGVPERPRRPSPGRVAAAAGGAQARRGGARGWPAADGEPRARRRAAQRGRADDPLRRPEGRPWRGRPFADAGRGRAKPMGEAASRDPAAGTAGRSGPKGFRALPRRRAAERAFGRTARRRRFPRDREERPGASGAVAQAGVAALPLRRVAPPDSRTGTWGRAAYWLPRSARRIKPGRGRRLVIGIRRAVNVGSCGIDSRVDQPTTWRENKSSATAM